MANISLILSEEQLEVLRDDAGINPADVYQISDTSFRPPIILSAYTNGWSIFFTDGEATDQEAYIKALLGSTAIAEPYIKNRGITVYAAPLVRFKKTANKVAVGTVP